jgi:hypothetical protein
MYTGLKLVCKTNSILKLGRMFNLPLPNFDEPLNDVKAFLNRVGKDSLDDFPEMQSAVEEYYGDLREDVVNEIQHNNISVRESKSAWSGWWQWLIGESRKEKIVLLASNPSDEEKRSVFSIFNAFKRSKQPSKSSASTATLPKGQTSSSVAFTNSNPRRNVVITRDIGYCAREFGLWLQRNDPDNKWGGLSRCLTKNNDVVFACKDCVINLSTIK